MKDSLARFTMFFSALAGAMACSGVDDEPGGTIGSGGNLGSGGNSDIASSGGASGGAVSTGGVSTGTGGVTGTGADTGTGGEAQSTGGDSSGTGGSNEANTDASTGCGTLDPPASGDFTIQVNGKTREYTLDVPSDYDSSNAYPLTFGLHWRGGNSGDVVSNNYYGLKNRANGGMIFVSPEGLVANGNSGWANAGGEDVELIALVLDHLESELCIDKSRVFATGFSFGGMFSNAIACELGDRFRAIAPYAGSLWSGCESGSDPVAYLGTHGVQDSVVGIDAGRQARDEFISRNGCSNTSSAYGSNGCVKYDGCQEGYPLVWCEYTGDHGWPNFSTDVVWEFFSQF